MADMIIIAIMLIAVLCVAAYGMQTNGVQNKGNEGEYVYMQWAVYTHDGACVRGSECDTRDAAMRMATYVQRDHMYPVYVDTHLV